MAITHRSCRSDQTVYRRIREGQRVMGYRESMVFLGPTLILDCKRPAEAMILLTKRCMGSETTHPRPAYSGTGTNDKAGVKRQAY